MSVWHTGDNSAQIYHNRTKESSSQMAPNAVDIPTPSQLDVLVAEFKRNFSENVEILVKSIIRMINGGLNPSAIDFKTIAQITGAPDVQAQTYREHKVLKEGNNNEVSNSDWNNQSTSNNNNSWANQNNNDGGDGWGDENKSSGRNNNSNDNRNPRRDNQSGRGGFNGGQSRPPRDPKPGDWKCSKCNAKNYDYRTTCFRRDCGEPKGDADSSTGGNGGNTKRTWNSNNSNNDGGNFKRTKVDDEPINWDDEPATAMPAASEKKVSPKHDDDW